MKKGADIGTSLGKIIQQLSELRDFVVRHKVVIFIVANLVVFGFLVYKIGTFSTVGADQAKADEQLKTTFRLKIDQEAVDKIQQLQDQNVAVQSLFKAARDNPFQE